MSLLAYLLPFIVVLGLIGLVVFSINRIAGKRNKYVSSKRIYLMLGSYVVVLLVATALSFKIPVHQDMVFHYFIDLDINPHVEHITSKSSLHAASPYIFNEKEFLYENDELIIRLNASNDRYNDVRVLVERKASADQLVEATIYQTPTFINHLNITEYIEPMTVNISLNELYIDRIWTDFSYASFKTEFPFRQFENERQLWFEEEIVFGQQLLLLRVPKNVKLIEKEHVEIVYVEE